MSRISALANRPRRTLAALATVLVAVGVTVASGADFTASSANPNTSFATGTLSIYNSKQGAAVMAATNLRPGDPAQTGQVDIGNSGSLAADFTLTRGAPVDSDATNKLSTKLNLTIVDCGEFDGGGNPPTCDAGDTVEYTGTLAGMSSAVALESFAGGERHRYEFSVTVDSSAGNEYQGDNSSALFTWNAA